MVSDHCPLITCSRHLIDLYRQADLELMLEESLRICMAMSQAELSLALANADHAQHEAEVGISQENFRQRLKSF